MGVYENWRTHRKVRPNNASDVDRGLSSCRADADGAGLASNTLVPYIDIVVARREIGTGEIAQCHVADAGCVIHERGKTLGRVAVAGCVVIKRKIANCRVVVAGRVEKEGETTVGRVPDALAGGEERCIP